MVVVDVFAEGHDAPEGIFSRRPVLTSGGGMLDCTAEATDMAQREAEKLRRELDRVEGR